MVDTFNRYMCDACGEEILKPVGEAPKGWSSTDEYGDLCPNCIARLKGFIRDFYGDETELCRATLRTIDAGI